ncbi:MAG TPA: hypothetical protein VKF40_09370 [Burkholderiales bacterium]|nr:hypothetical protein [Burkholderiales bacterium]
MRLRTLHLVVGVAGLIVFAATGQYMRLVHAGLQGMPDGPRLFFRSAHIYLLWSSLLNFVLGCYFDRVRHGALRHVQSLGSLVILAGPFMLCASFFVEQYNPGLLRPIGQLAVFLSFGGALLHAISVAAYRAKSKT